MSLAFGLVFGVAAVAETVTWIGASSTSADWSAPGNWKDESDVNRIPGPNDIAHIENCHSRLDVDISVSGISYNGFTRTLAASDPRPTITLGSDGIKMVGYDTSRIWTIDTHIALSTDVVWSIGPGHIRINSALGGDSIISGNARIIKQGSGRLSLRGAHTFSFSGGIDVQSGELRVRDNSNLGAGKLTLRDNTVFNLDGGQSALPFPNDLELAGSIQFGTGRADRAITFDGGNITLLGNATLALSATDLLLASLTLNGNIGDGDNGYGLNIRLPVMLSST